MQSPFITELNEQNFHQVLESSTQQPVLIHFWASMSQESVELLNPLRQLAQSYQGAFLLATLDCEQQQAIAAQFGVQALPTLALFINGQPIDGLGGPQSIEAIETMLAKHLPSQDELSLQQALALMAGNQHQQALTLLTQLSPDFQEQGEVKIALTECYIEVGQFDTAQTLLDSIPLQFHDNHYKGLLAKLELHAQASNSPEIQQLEQKHAKNPDDHNLVIELAIQYQQVSRNEEALELLWKILSRDLNAADGEIKKSFMDILSALGQDNSLAKNFRRKLYSMLY